MITYERGGIHYFLKLFKTNGSVFPFALKIAFPCSVLAAAVRMLINFELLNELRDPRAVILDNAVWGGFSFLVGFLVVFRTSQAYSRFWDGCTSTHQMRAEWFDACSALVSFCKHSKAAPQQIEWFKHTLIRLFSMLHALALAEIEDSDDDDMESIEAFKYELLDAHAIDAESLQTIKISKSKVELVYQWIQQLIVEQIQTEVMSIPAPILSRAFQEIANGMVQFHEALKISTIPFPFPYAQTCDCLLVMHWFCVPLVVATWVTEPWWALIFSFIQVFILWSLNCIAVEIENPFGRDANDIDAEAMQAEINVHLRMLLNPETLRTPQLSQEAAVYCLEPYYASESSAPRDPSGLGSRSQHPSLRRRSSFVDVWNDLSRPAMETPDCSRRLQKGMTNDSLCDSVGSLDTLNSFQSRHSSGHVGRGVRRSRRERRRSAGSRSGRLASKNLDASIGAEVGPTDNGPTVEVSESSTGDVTQISFVSEIQGTPRGGLLGGRAQASEQQSRTGHGAANGVEGLPAGYRLGEAANGPHSSQRGLAQLRTASGDDGCPAWGQTLDPEAQLGGDHSPKRHVPPAMPKG